MKYSKTQNCVHGYLKKTFTIKKKLCYVFCTISIELIGQRKTFRGNKIREVKFCSVDAISFYMPHISNLGDS